MNERSGNSGQLPPGAKIYTAPPEPAAVPVDEVNLDALAWKSLMDAARQTEWMPREYMVNDWLADLREYLIKGPAAFAPDQGWLIADGSGERFQFWGDTGPEWTADRSAALWFARRADAEAVARDNEDAWFIYQVNRCTLPPIGWECTLASGHDGPCPTIRSTHPQPAAAKTGHFTTDEMLEATAVLRAQQAKPEVQP